MYYFVICVAALLFSCQFIFHNGYRTETGSDWNSTLNFSFYTSALGLIALLAINGFHAEISIFSFIVASVYSVVSISLVYSSMKAFHYANLSVYSVFSMIGGMVLPFFYGILCGEKFEWGRIICCVFIALSVGMSITKSGCERAAVKYYIAVFILNGLVGVISKFHQSYMEIGVDSGSFMILTKVTSLLFSIILLALQKQHKRFSRIGKKAFLYSALYAVVNSTGNLLLLIALLHLPASVQYPLVTGGTIVFSTIIVILRKEKIKKREILAAVTAFVSTVLMI